MSAVPDYTAMCAEFGDPDVVLGEITEVVEQPLPRIDEAHAHAAPEEDVDDEVVGGCGMSVGLDVEQSTVEEAEERRVRVQNGLAPM